MKTKKILTILLCLFILVGCANKTQNNEPTKRKETKTNYTKPDYFHYEIGDYKQRCDKLVSDALQGVFNYELYDELYDEALMVCDISSVIYVEYCNDVTNKTNEDESVYIENVVEEICDYLASASHTITTSKCADEFKNYLDNDKLYNDYCEYKEKTQEEIELIKQETDLIYEYNALIGDYDNYSIEINGISYSYGQLQSEEGDDLYYNHRDLYYDYYNKIRESFNKDAGELFLKLVNIRQNIANLNGYDNYAEYADEKKYKRNYDVSKLDVLKNISKEYGDYVEFYFGNYRSYDEHEIPTDILLTNTANIIKQISPEAYKYYQVLIDNNLYSIGNEQERYHGSFSTGLYGRNSALLFISKSDDLSDYYTLAHEFGHFYNMCVSKCLDPIIFNGSFDLFEIHSSGLEMLFSEKAKDIFGDDYDLIYADNISDKLYNVVSACIDDDWQREVYNNPNMTIDELNETYYRIACEYGFDYLCSPYDWCFIHHNFESPMYYMSYGVSFFTSLLIWKEAQDDFDKAVNIWENIVHADCFSNGYFDVVDKTKLASITDENAVIDTYINALTYLDDVYIKYIE